MIETQIDIKLSCAFPCFSSPNSRFSRYRANKNTEQEAEFTEKGEKEVEGGESHKRQRGVENVLRVAASKLYDE